MAERETEPDAEPESETEAEADWLTETESVMLALSVEDPLCEPDTEALIDDDGLADGVIDEEAVEDKDTEPVTEGVGGITPQMNAISPELSQAQIAVGNGPPSTRIATVLLKGIGKSAI